MLKSRRKFITHLLSLGGYSLTFASGILHSSLANAQWLQQRFSLSNYDETILHLFNGAELINNHNKIKFHRLPYIAENGTSVPIKITSTLKNVTKIYILVEKNPHPLSAEFFLSPAMEPQVSARLKMAQTSKVVTIIEADGKFYRKVKKVKVAIGGCGG